MGRASRFGIVLDFNACSPFSLLNRAISSSGTPLTLIKACGVFGEVNRLLTEELLNFLGESVSKKVPMQVPA